MSRIALLDLLDASSRTPVVAILAPPGYGKTAILAQWAARDPRAFGWLTIDRRDNDPAVLLRNLADAVDRIEPVDRAAVAAVDGQREAVVDAVLPQLGSALATAALPAVLVLDDVHLLRNRDCLDAVTRLIDDLPAGSQLAIASRGEPPLPLARLRAEGRVVEVGPEDLAMNSAEAGSLLEHADVDPAPVDVAELVRRTEGWPVALQFAARSLVAGHHRRPARAVVLAGDDRFLVDYLHFELLSRLPERLVSFLTRCSVLDRMSGPLCDAVLATTGSADLLESLSRSNIMTTPLDRRRQRYRFHRLFRELLRSQLERQEPGLAGELTRRSAEWCEDSGLPEPAIEYAMAAGDADRAARLVVRAALPTYADGRLADLQRWFAWFEARGLVERHAGVAVVGAWTNALAGRPVAAERWADAADRAPSGGFPTGGDASTDGPLGLLRAARCRDGVERMGADAELALALAPTGSAWQASAQLLLGISRLLAGQLDEADRCLADAAEVGGDAGVDTAVLALAERSILAMARGDWRQAVDLAERARAGARRSWLEQYPSGALLFAVTARLAIHRGDVPRARDDLARAGRLCARLTWALPHLAIQVRLELARGYLALTDAAAARRLLREVDDLLSRRPRLGLLRDQAAALHARLDTMLMDAVGASALTAAEVRLLRLLGTTTRSGRSAASSACPSTPSSRRPCRSTGSSGCRRAARPSATPATSACSSMRCLHMGAHEEQLCRLALHDEAFIESVLAMDLNSNLNDDEACRLSPKTRALVRLAALLALGAAPVSYQWNVGAALDAGATADEILGTMIAVAPISGVARVVQATLDVALPIGYDLDAAFEELDPDPPA